MRSAQVSGAGWEFDTFRLMPDKRLLLRGGEPVPLTSKAFDTLVALVENRDRVVGKDELLHAIWPDVVVEEGNLTQQIFLVRKALGDTAHQPRYVVTVPGRGYRFTAPVSAIPPEAPGRGDEGDAGALKTLPMTARWRPQRTLPAITFVTLLAGLAAVLVWSLRTPPVRDRWLDPATVQIQRITGTGSATSAAISPDGRYVAYVESEGDEHSLHLQEIATSGKTQLIPPQRQMLTSLRFSPDGQFLYFTRGTLVSGGFALSRIPAIGGPETLIGDDIDTPVSFSPDGRQFVFMRGAIPDTLIMIGTVGGGQRVLETLTAPLAFSFVPPAWSPDGKWVAAPTTDQTQGGRSSIVLMPVDGGSRRELYSSDDHIGALRWLPDGSGLLTVISESAARQFPPWQAMFVGITGGSLWRIGFPDGDAERLTSGLAEYDLCCVDVDANGRTITAVLNSVVSDLWITPRDGSGGATQITRGHPVMARHAWLPDNDTIVYRDLDGRLHAVRKDRSTFSLPVPPGHKVAGGVSACGDGRHVVFATVPGNSLWRVTPANGDLTRLTSGHIDSNPACWPDGTSVLYSSIRQGLPSLWRIPMSGGDPAPFLPGESFDAVPSPTGRFVYYAAFEWDEEPVRLRRRVWRVIDAGTGKQFAAINRPAGVSTGTLPAWAPDESGLDYLVTRNGVSNVWRQPLDGGEPVQITHFDTWRIFSFGWSPDARWLSLARGLNRRDVVVISR